MSRPGPAGAESRAAGRTGPARVSVPVQGLPGESPSGLGSSAPGSSAQGSPAQGSSAQGGPGPGQDREARLTEELAQERHTAIELQRAILPLHDGPFDLPGLRAVVRYLPASKAGLVGGDWYITAEMPTGQVLIAIGDVAGHGLAAAAGMARLRGALAGLAITGAAPGRLVGWLNDLVHHVDAEHTASVATGYFDPASRKLTWAQAGHLPPVVVRRGQAWLLDPPAGILLGAGAGGYAVCTQQLEQGDLLLLYSDGLVERRDRSLDDGLTALTEAACGSAAPEQAVDTILSILAPAEAEDDTCLVALQVL